MEGSSTAVCAPAHDKIHELRTGLYQRGYEILQERAALAKGICLYGHAGLLVWKAAGYCRFVCLGRAVAPNTVERGAGLFEKAGADSKEHCGGVRKIKYKSE